MTARIKPFYVWERSDEMAQRAARAKVRYHRDQRLAKKLDDLLEPIEADEPRAWRNPQPVCRRGP